MAMAARLSRGRVYYGWYIVAALFISSTATTSFVPAVFLKPMTQDLGWSRGFFSTAVALSGLMTSPLSMVLWPIVDRRGARGVMLVSGLILGFGTMALGLVQDRWHFFLIKTLLMPFGQVGVGPMMSMMVVPNWFVRKRGRAMAIAAMGMSVGSIFLPPLATFLIGALGWRQAWMVMGLIILVVLLTPVLLFLRRRPEDMGLLPDGDLAPATTAAGKPPPTIDVTWTRREALRNRTFWLLAFAIPLGMMGMGVVNQHFVAYLTDMKYSPQSAAFIFSAVSVASLSIKLPWGFLMERVRPRFLYATAFALVGLGLIILVLAGADKGVLVLAAVVLGIGWGGNIPLQGFIYASYFGRQSQGKMRSLASPLTSISGPLGPILAGFVWDTTGSYHGIFTAYVGTAAVGVLLMLLTRPPVKPQMRPESAT